MLNQSSTDGSADDSKPAQRYEDVIIEDREQQMCAIRSQTDSERESLHTDLASSSLLSYLDLDERPTFAVRICYIPHSERSIEIIYSNPALKIIGELLVKVTGQENERGLFVESASPHRAFRDWLLGVSDETDRSRHGSSYFYEGHLWTAVNMKHCRIVSGVVTCMMWSDQGNSRLRASLDPKESGFPKHHPPLKTYLSNEIQALQSPDVNAELKAKLLNRPSPAQKQHGSYDYTSHSSPVRNMSDHIKYFRETNWSQTCLGGMASWSPELRCVVNMTLSDNYPAILFWGDSAIMVYNEAYIQLLGALHPCMGKSANTYSTSYWPTLVPLMQHINATGASLREHDVPLFIDRHGFLEETYWSFQFTPVLNGQGHITGYYHHLFETTKHHLLERRVSSLVELGSQIAHARTFESFWEIALQTLTLNNKDVPFALLYSTEHQSSSEVGSISSPGASVPTSAWKCVLKGSIGIDSGHPLAPSTVDISNSSYVFHSYLLEAAKAGKATIVHLEDLHLPDSVLADVNWQGYGDHCRIVVVCPIMPTTGENAQVEGFVILGANPRRPFDENYQKFVHVMVRLLATSLASVALFDTEVRQKEKAIENAATLQKQLLDEIQAKEKKFQSFAERSDVAIFIMDAKGRYIYRNRRWYDMFEVAADSGDAMEAWTNIAFPEDIPKCETLFEKLVVEKIPVNFELETKMMWSPPPDLQQTDCGVSQHHKWILCSAYPELGPDNELVEIVGSVTDISKQKWAEGVQKIRTDSALKSKQHLEHFIDTTSHEMRNPLSAIMQCADGILSSYSFSDRKSPNQTTQSVLLEQTLESAQTIAQCAQHMRHIVDDILTVSKLDSGLLVITPVDTQPENVVRHAVKMFDSEAKAAGVDLSFAVDKSYRILGMDWVSMDPTRVLQILINLLTNAIKFTRLEKDIRHITITLAASATEPTSAPEGVQFIGNKLVCEDHQLEQDWKQGRTHFIQFSVSDTGRGLTQEQTKSLFTRFTQASPRTHVHYGGSGLGLFISRQLTELQGGSIGLFSEYKKGSTFSFYIKARQVNPNMLRKGSLPDMFPEDIRHRSQSPSISIRHPVPLVLPEMVRENSQSWRHEHANSFATSSSSLPIELPSAMPSAKALNLLAPLKFAKLRREESVPGTLHVLIVEDNLVNQKVLAKQLRNLGCIVSVANHGGESLEFLSKTTRWNHDAYNALSLLRRQNMHLLVSDSTMQTSHCTPVINSEPVELSLILMDWEMPIMNGLTAVVKIREMEKDGLLNGRVPVVGVTANVRQEQIDTAIQAGMDDVVGKPFRVTELLTRMRRVVMGVEKMG